MRSIAMLGALAVFAAAPLAAQGTFRTEGAFPTGGSQGTIGGVLGDILGRDTARVRTDSKKSDHIPPGQLPPAGMCRIWIDGVPPGRQPAPTDCQTAVATKPANARVIWGDQTPFPGKGKGRFKQGPKEQDRIWGVDRDDDDIRGVNRPETHGKAASKHGKGKSIAKHGKKG